MNNLPTTNTIRLIHLIQREDPGELLVSCGLLLEGADAEVAVWAFDERRPYDACPKCLLQDIRRQQADLEDEASELMVEYGLDDVKAIDPGLPLPSDD